MSEWVVLYRAAQHIEAHILKGLLEHNGIPCRIEGEDLSGAVGELPTDVREVRLFVHPLQLARARLLIEPPMDKPDWYCTQCGELNEGQYELCWQCGQPQSE
ncbi:DUF2007 domain-containing protein [Thaumasiovibrio sp. DFM-14]|uniref:putative signal transducing protein n=1 Tax=Thaumasiovibrio sp. DFM-14 TaxID=3384792 RepID=UPI0039A1BDB6